MTTQQLSLLDVPPAPVATDPTWGTWKTSDDWEAPDSVARAIAAEVRDGSIPGLPRDRVIIDAGAGCGQISQFLPAGSICIESNLARVALGQLKAPHCVWHQANFLTWDFEADTAADLVIGNPPFSLAAEFLNHALELIHDRGRVVFLLPCDTVHKPEAFLAKIKFDFTHSDRPIVGRIAYLRDGRPVAGRQVYDSIFTFWPYPQPNPVLIHQT